MHIDKHRQSREWTCLQSASSMYSSSSSGSGGGFGTKSSAPSNCRNTPYSLKWKDATQERMRNIAVAIRTGHVIGRRDKVAGPRHVRGRWHVLVGPGHVHLAGRHPVVACADHQWLRMLPLERPLGQFTRMVQNAPGMCSSWDPCGSRASGSSPGIGTSGADSDSAASSGALSLGICKAIRPIKKHPGPCPCGL